MPETSVENSILDSIKKLLQIEPSYDEFDVDIMIHINSVFSTLYQIGVGPQTGAYRITSQANAWSEFIGDDTFLEEVKSYIYLRVKRLFDPPETSFANDSFKDQLKEMEWRLQTYSPPADYSIGGS